jgi:hypothetical protein
MKKGRNFSEDKKKLVLGMVTVALVIIAILGYALEKKKEPVRMAFDTAGGGVIFDHKMHASLKDTKCGECHHNEDEDARNCRECHYAGEFKGACADEAIHKRCIGKNCMSCHAEGSVQCDFCHNAENFARPKPPKTLEFTTDGGPVAFDHFTHSSKEGYDLECATCHHGYNAENAKTYPMNCRRCHYNKKYEPICKDADTHARCIGKNCLSCHEDGSEDCSICHGES